METSDTGSFYFRAEACTPLCVGVAWDKLACGVSPATAQARQLNGYFVPTETDFGAKRQSGRQHLLATAV